MKTAKQLISSQVVVGFPEQRLSYLAERIEQARAQYCVVLRDHGREIAGLVRFSDVAADPSTAGRILADLAGPPPGFTVQESEPPEAVRAIFEASGPQEITVVTPSHEYLGLITPESFTDWLLARERDLTGRLETLVAEQSNLADFLERKARQQTDQLRDTLSEFETMCLSLSHDVRAPLRAIRGFSEALLEDFGEGLAADAKTLAGRIRDTAVKGEALAENVLEQARRSFGEKSQAMQVIDLNEVFTDALQFLDSNIRARGAKVVARDRLHKITGYYTGTLQIFINLIGNAVKYAPEGRQPKVDVWTETSGTKVVLRIKDNGAGIAPHEQQVLAESNGVGSLRSADGHGLGLAIVRNAVKALGGTIDVSSRAGSGSTFSITLQLGEG